ncbi:hypothetical protein DFH08DRAFT_952191 [Mycena albidolilacea]|uniref:Uncharacterized protein n=1 Tax=Mycena albidolilacea TaxID=1033008 RepID=A0AAD7AL51_9AGAR|nr:hypothetical protein DFH08DRAFT_952191 [Mycena albidolilacea]
MENPPNASDSASTSSEPRTPSSGSSGSDRGSPSTERYHPYGGEKRKKAKTTAKPTKTNRKIWPCAHEKALFNIWELTELGVTQRRPIYVASLEAHIDRLHAQLAGLGPEFFPVDMEELERLKGLNAKTCKTMIASLHNNLMQDHERLLELQRTNETLEAALHTERR